MHGYTSRFHSNLKKVYSLPDVKVSLGLTELKAINIRWIVDQIILNGFKAAGIADVVGSVNAVLQRIENPFTKKEM